MKSISIILSSTLLFLSLASFAQTSNKFTAQPTTPNVPKGYYSIGTNAERLNTGKDTIQPVRTPVITRGYYSMELNLRKISKKARWINTTGSTPVVTKGYYSIGNNNEKLNLNRKQ